MGREGNAIVDGRDMALTRGGTLNTTPTHAGNAFQKGLFQQLLQFQRQTLAKTSSTMRVLCPATAPADTPQPLEEALPYPPVTAATPDKQKGTMTGGVNKGRRG